MPASTYFINKYCLLFGLPCFLQAHADSDTANTTQTFSGKTDVVLDFTLYVLWSCGHIVTKPWLGTPGIVIIHMRPRKQRFGWLPLLPPSIPTAATPPIPNGCLLKPRMETPASPYTTSFQLLVYGSQQHIGSSTGVAFWVTS